MDNRRYEDLAFVISDLSKKRKFGFYKAKIYSFFSVVLQTNNFVPNNFSYSRQNLHIVENMKDFVACGRTYGNIGNSYYMLGDYATAVYYHNKVSVPFIKRVSEFCL